MPQNNPSKNNDAAIGYIDESKKCTINWEEELKKTKEKSILAEWFVEKMIT